MTLHSKRIIQDIQDGAPFIKQFSEIILNINDYQNFIPHCTHSKIITQNENFILATLIISFASFKVNYTSKITVENANERIIITTSEKEPHVFKTLRNIWILSAKENSLEINFFVEFEIKNKILNIIAGKALPLISGIIMNAFISKAKKDLNF